MAEKIRIRRTLVPKRWTESETRAWQRWFSTNPYDGDAAAAASHGHKAGFVAGLRAARRVTR